VDSALTYGRTHRCNIDMAEEYVDHIEDDCAIALGAREYIKQCCFRVWALLAYTLAVGVIGSLIASAIWFLTFKGSPPA
jgi:hypothetical protein